ncbi:sigma-70 family RNA polymerase sigma factor [Nannocystis sp. ILAH1]|uniref:RNA polymerase sigma factor n=1 Tax=unclassified Nannocystis TaxID=2627009 RepID=UPI00226E2191|nr:sigma-70 family RNA polymerase sigma factor [Nannocystis sp. ILAH1]MCY1064008.1 sigma-70 family RNA polymerase sigma factor [Nannocystis sp. RBIL2]
MAPESDDDETLLAAWRQGERAAGQRLFERYYEAVARFFVNKVGDAGTELIQKTFLACVEGMPRFRGDGSFRSYLFAIAYRQLCLHYKRRASEPVDLASQSVAGLDPSVAGVLVEREEQRLLLAALRSIALELQVVLELHYWEQCSVVEIAAALEIPQGTVKSRLRRGREQLREAIERLAATRELALSTFRGLESWAAAVRARARERP